MDENKHNDNEKLNTIEYVYNIKDEELSEADKYIEEQNEGDKKNEKDNGNTIMKFFREWIVPVIAAFAIALAINKLIFFNIIVPTKSMYPTIKPNDRILVTRVHNADKLKRGDIVVFHSNELDEDLIKRLIGIPNDVVEIRDDEHLYINGELQEEEYVINNGGRNGKFEVPEGHYLFMGDNRSNSHDARYWENKYISEDDIMGKAQIVILPFNRMGKLK